MPANYLMDSSSVRLSYWVGHRREQKYYSYSDLSGGAVYTLNSTEQIHMAEVFGRYLATSGYVSARNVWPGGRGVQVK